MNGQHSQAPFAIFADAEHAGKHPNHSFRFIGTADFDEDRGTGQILAKLTDSPEIEANAHLFAAAPDTLAALSAAVERMEYVAARILVHNRHKGVSQATHVAHMAGHLEQHAKIARAAIAKAKGGDS